MCWGFWWKKKPVAYHWTSDQGKFSHLVNILEWLLKRRKRRDQVRMFKKNRETYWQNLICEHYVSTDTNFWHRLLRQRSFPMVNYKYQSKVTEKQFCQTVTAGRDIFPNLKWIILPSSWLNNLLLTNYCLAALSFGEQLMIHTGGVCSKKRSGGQRWVDCGLVLGTPCIHYTFPDQSSHTIVFLISYPSYNHHHGHQKLESSLASKPINPRQ